MPLPPPASGTHQSDVGPPVLRGRIPFRRVAFRVAWSGLPSKLPPNPDRADNETTGMVRVVRVGRALREAPGRTPPPPPPSPRLWYAPESGACRAQRAGPGGGGSSLLTYRRSWTIRTIRTSPRTTRPLAVQLPRPSPDHPDRRFGLCAWCYPWRLPPVLGPPSFVRGPTSPVLSLCARARACTPRSLGPRFVAQHLCAYVLRVIMQVRGTTPPANRRGLDMTVFYKTLTVVASAAIIVPFTLAFVRIAAGL